MRLVTGTVDERGNFADLVPSYRYRDKGSEPYLDPELCHPRYLLPDEKAEYVENFVAETLERWKQGTCDAPYQPEQEE
jgi:hypothetical protein